MKKIYFLFLGLLLSLGAIAQYGGGAGVDGNPYLISSAADLIELSNTEADWDKNFLLTTDIDMAGQTFYSIGGYYGNVGYYFSGEFDGGSKIISNLTVIKRDNQTYQLGFFGQTNGDAVIKNLGIVNIHVVDGSVGRVGGVVGTIEEATIIQNCFVDGGNVEGGDAVGGIVGWIRGGGEISNCYSNVYVKDYWGDNKNSGGIVGYVEWAPAEVLHGKWVVYGTNFLADAAILGQSQGVFAIEDAYYSSQSGTDVNGTLISNLDQLSNYNGFDLSKWKVDTSRGYAVLASFTSLPTDIAKNPNVSSTDIYVSGNVLYINSELVNATYQVYNISGHIVTEGLVQGADFNTTLEVSSGMYIVKVGNDVEKVVLR